MSLRSFSVISAVLIATALHAQDESAMGWAKGFYAAMATASSYAVKADVNMLAKGSDKVVGREHTEAYRSEGRMLTILPGRTALVAEGSIVVVDKESHTIFRQARKATAEGSVGGSDPLQEISTVLAQAQDRLAIIASDEQTVTLRINTPGAGYACADITLGRSDHLPTRIVYRLAAPTKGQQQDFDRVEVVYTELRLNCTVPAERFDEQQYVRKGAGDELLPAKGYEGYHIIRS